MKNKFLPVPINFYKFLVLFFILFSFLAAPAALAHHDPEHKPLTLFGQDLNCFPDLPPKHEQGCGLDDFIVLLKAIIDFLAKTVVIPVATLMVIWAAYVIITAGGSAEKFQKGRAIIATAVIGVTIALLAGAIVGFVYELITGEQLTK